VQKRKVLNTDEMSLSLDFDFFRIQIKFAVRKILDSKTEKVFSFSLGRSTMTNK